MRGHEIPEAGRNARGFAVINLINLEPGERIQATIPVEEYSDDRYLTMATRNGTIKKNGLKRIRNKPQRRADLHHSY